MVQVQDIADLGGKLIRHKLFRSDRMLEEDGFQGADHMGLMSLGIGQDPASEADREDRAGNHSVCDLKIIFFRDLVVSAVDAPAQVS